MEGSGVFDDPHPAPATTARCLDDHRVANGVRDGSDFGRISREVLVRAGHARDARLPHRPFRRDLVAHDPDAGRARPDEDQPGRLDLGRELGIFRQEAVARVDCPRSRDLRGVEDGRLVQVALPRGGWADAQGLVRLRHIRRCSIGLGIHGDGAQAQAAAGALDAQGDLAAIGDQDGVEHATARAGTKFGSLRPLARFRPEWRRLRHRPRRATR